MESHLLGAFIPAAYRHDPSGRWKAQDAERWLAFLARHLERTRACPDLAWWQLPQAVPGFAIVGGLVATPVLGFLLGFTLLLAQAVGILLVLAAGFTAAAACGAGFVWRALVGSKPVQGIRWQLPSRGRVVAIVVSGALAGAVFATAGVAAGIVGGIWVGVLIWAANQSGAPLDPSSAASPQAALAADRRAGTAAGIAAGVVGGVVTGVVIVGTSSVVLAIVAAILFGVAAALRLRRGRLMG